MLRTATQTYRPSPLAVARDARIFVISLTMDGSTAVEAGGSNLGCPMPVTMTVEQVIPGSLSGIPTTTLSSGSQMTNYVQVNGAGFVVPVARHSWGSLKSLYR